MKYFVITVVLIIHQQRGIKCSQYSVVRISNKRFMIL
jgi:hypothetical protein